MVGHEKASTFVEATITLLAQLFGMQETLSLQQACTSSQWISSAIIILAAYAGCTGFD